MPTTLVLGAGSSLASALHFHPVRNRSMNPPLDVDFFEKIAALRIAIPDELRIYGSTWAAVDPFAVRTSASPVRMESFFKELFGDFQDDPSPSSLPTVAYGQLVDIYTHVLRSTTNWLCATDRKGSPLGKLIQMLADHTDDLSIITFNHDLVIENEIFRRAKLRKRWCLTEGYGTFGTALTRTQPRSNRRAIFSVHSSACDHSRPITIYKLHGSLNWYVRLRGSRPTRTVLAGGATAPKVHMTTQRTVPAELKYSTPQHAGPGRTSWYTWPVVIPPVHEKDQLIRSYLRPVWDEARAALLRADRLVFCGYSLPILDSAAERLFQRPLSSSSVLERVEIIDPSPLVPSRYASLSPNRPFRWLPSIESFLTDG